VVERRVEEHEAGLAQALGGQCGREVNGYAQRLQHVSRSAAAGDGAIAVLGDFGAGGRSHQRSTGGDVEGERPAAARAHNVHQLGALLIAQRNRHGARAHHFHKAGQLRDLFAASGHHREQSGNFHIGHAAREDFRKGAGRLFAGQRGAIFRQRLEQFFQRGHIPIW